MLETLANILVMLIALYAVIGVGFAIFFVWRGVAGIDPSAEEGTWGFKLTILPGTVALWPVMLRRYRAGDPPPIEHNAHRDLVGGNTGRDGAAEDRELA